MLERESPSDLLARVETYLEDFKVASIIVVCDFH